MCARPAPHFAMEEPLGRCSCGAFALTTHKPWVLYPRRAHTPGKCGAYNGARVFLNFPSPPLLSVWWAGDDFPW